ARHFRQVLTKPLNLEALCHTVEAALTGSAVPEMLTTLPEEPALDRLAHQPHPSHPSHAVQATQISLTPPAEFALRRRWAQLIAALRGVPILTAGLGLVLPTLGFSGIPNLLHMVTKKPAPPPSPPPAIKPVSLARLEALVNERNKVTNEGWPAFWKQV